MTTIANKRTPWGYSDDAEEIAPGIHFYGTPSHGGYWLSAERYREMPNHLKACSVTKNQWFEEDCSWCAVVLAFPQYFDERKRQVAKQVYETYYAKKVQ